jgi:transforming growth factor-beta-induced protein
MRKLLLVLAVLVAVMSFTGIPAMAQDSGTIVDIAANNPDFSTLVTAVSAAGLVDTLSGEGPFTVFAPTNAAFEAFGADTVNAALADTDLLTSILTYHVVPGALSSEQVAAQSELTTVQGGTISVDNVNGSLRLNGNVGFVTTNIQASNGVIHVIDAVLLPPSETAAEPETALETVHIRVAHFSPDTPAVDVYVNGELSAVQGLEFPNVTEWIELPAGTYNLAVSPAGTSLEDAAIGPADFDLPANAWITVAAVGSPANGTLTAAPVIEDYSPIPDGSARVTVFHGIEDAPAVDVLAGGAAVVSQLAFPGALDGSNDGAFTLDVPAGSYDLQVVPAGETSPVVLDLPGTQLDAGMNYFVAAVGTLDAPQVVVQATDTTAMMDETAAEPAGTIVDIAVSNPDFSTLVAAVGAAGLVETLSGEGPFTVFAPTNAAFEALGVDTVNAVLADTDLLTSILTYHVVPGALSSEQVSAQSELVTVEGSTISVSAMDNSLMLNGNVGFVTTDIPATNGVIHVIDAVLLPPSE